MRSVEEVVVIDGRGKVEKMKQGRKSDNRKRDEEQKGMGRLDVDKQREFIVCKRCEGVRQQGLAEEREFKKEERSSGEHCHCDFSMDSYYF